MTPLRSTTMSNAAAPVAATPAQLPRGPKVMDIEDLASPQAVTQEGKFPAGVPASTVLDLLRKYSSEKWQRLPVIPTDVLMPLVCMRKSRAWLMKWLVSNAHAECWRVGTRQAAFVVRANGELALYGVGAPAVHLSNKPVYYPEFRFHVPAFKSAYSLPQHNANARAGNTCDEGCPYCAWQHQQQGEAQRRAATLIDLASSVPAGPAAQGQDKIAETSGEARNPGPPKWLGRVLQPVKKAAKSEMRKRVRGPLKSFKDAVHAGRQQIDQTLPEQVPIVGSVAKVAVDVVDDALQTILIDPRKKSAREWVVEKNPGPPKSKSAKRRRKSVKSVKTAIRKLRRAESNMTSIRMRPMRSAPSAARLRTGVLSKRTVRSAGRDVGYTMVSRDYLGAKTILGSAATGAEVYGGGIDINPHAIASLDLSLEAKRWELFDCDVSIHAIKVGNSLVEGRLFGYFDPDPTDFLSPDGETRIKVGMLHGGKPVEFNKGGTWKPAPNTRAKAVPWYYVDAFSGNADKRQSIKWKFRLMVERSPHIFIDSTNTEVDLVVEFYITYNFRFRNRTFDTPDSSPAGGFMEASGTATHSQQDPLGVAGALPSFLTAFGMHLDIGYRSTDTKDFIALSVPSGASLPAYIVIGAYLEGTGMSGGGLFEGDVNATNIDGGAESFGGGGTSLTCWHVFQPTDPHATGTVTPTSAYTHVEGIQRELRPAAPITVGMSFKFGITTATTVTYSEFFIMAIPYPTSFQLEHAKWQRAGPATLEHEWFTAKKRQPGNHAAEYKKWVEERAQSKTTQRRLIAENHDLRSRLDLFERKLVDRSTPVSSEDEATEVVRRPGLGLEIRESKKLVKASPASSVKSSR